MNAARYTIAGGILLLAISFPFTASAEDVSTGGETTGITPPPAAPASVDGWSFGESNMGTMPPKGGMGEGRELPPKPEVTAPRDPASGLPTGKRQHEPIRVTKPIDKATPKLLEKAAPRDAASGQATGKMMASGTRPLPQGMEDRLEKRDEMKDRRASTSQEMEERKEEMQKQLLEKRGEVLKRMIEQQVHRMAAMIERLEKLAGRLESRIEKLKEGGADTAKTEELLALARTRLSEAKAALEAAKSAAEDIASEITASVGLALGPGGSPQADLLGEKGAMIRAELKKAREAVMAAHKALVDAIASLNARGVRPGGVPATTTATSQ